MAGPWPGALPLRPCGFLSAAAPARPAEVTPDTETVAGQNSATRQPRRYRYMAKPTDGPRAAASCLQARARRPTTRVRGGSNDERCGRHGVSWRDAGPPILAEASGREHPHPPTTASATGTARTCWGYLLAARTCPGSAGRPWMQPPRRVADEKKRHVWQPLCPLEASITGE
jgi:hypothetical protein